MKWLVALLLLTSTVWAESPYTLDRIEAEEQLDTARVQRTAGAVLTVIGAAMWVGSLAMTVGALSEGLPIDCDGKSCQNAPLFYTGLALSGTSSVLLSVGVPLWVVGNAKVKKLAHVGGFFGKNGGGASVRMSF